MTLSSAPWWWAPGFGVGVDGDCAGPDLLGADAGVVDGGLAEHAGGLGGVGVELVALDDADAVVAPIFGDCHDWWP